MLRIYFISMAIAVLVFGQATASTQQGLAALRAGDFMAAHRMLSVSAQAGDADAQFALCGMYFQGQGVPVNDIEAFQWCKLAADKGHVEAMYNTALFYQKGEGTGQNFAAAMTMYQKAADAGHPDAQFNLLQLYNANVLASQAGTAGGLKTGLLPPLGVPLDEAGNPVSFNPLKVPPDARQPIAGVAPAATAAVAISQLPQATQGTKQQVPAGVLNQLSNRVGGVPAQIPQAIPAVPNSQISAQIPQAIPRAPLTAANQREYQAELACMEAARQGVLADNCGAQPALARVQPKPQQIAAVAPKKEVVDVKNTIGWFEKQAELGDLAAQNNLGVIYRRGTGVPKQPERALDLFEKSAARGSVNGMLNLANMYKLGEGTEQNLELSYAWYSLASDRLPAGASKKAALSNIKEIAGFMDNQQIGSALEYVTQLDSSIPLIDEELVDLEG